MNKDKGLIQMIGGAILTILGVIGIIKAKDIKSQVTRLLACTIAGIAIFTGIYLLILGYDDYAIARIGVTPLTSEKAAIRPNKMAYPDYKAFMDGLIVTFEQENLRRLKFVCRDKSNEFTVYNTALGIFNVPTYNVKCKDGTYLLYYSKK